MRVHRCVGAVVAGIFVIGVASGCGNPLRDLQDRVVESGIERLIESGSGVDGVDLFGTEVPEGFPNVVPLPDAELIASFHLTENEVTTWSLSYRPERAASLDDYAAQLENAGFVRKESGSMAGVIDTMTFESDSFSVSVIGVGEGSDSTLQVMVQEREA